MTLRRWEPFRDLMSLREAMDRLVEDSFVRPTAIATGPTMSVPLDVYETSDDLVVKAALPGWKSDDIDISITGDTLTLKGEWKAERENDDRNNYYLKETRVGSFSRSLTLPMPVKVDAIDATFENGVLTLHIPKAEEVKPRQIKVKAREAIEARK